LLRIHLDIVNVNLHSALLDTASNGLSALNTAETEAYLQQATKPGNVGSHGWILRRPRISGLHPVNASICYLCHQSEWAPANASQFPLCRTSASISTPICQWGSMS